MGERKDYRTKAKAKKGESAAAICQTRRGEGGKEALKEKKSLYD